MYSMCQENSKKRNRQIKIAWAPRKQSPSVEKIDMKRKMFLRKNEFQVEAYKYDDKVSDKKRAALQRVYEGLSPRDQRFVRKIDSPAVRGLFLEEKTVSRKFLREHYK